MKHQPGLKMLLTQPEDEDDEEHFVDVDTGDDDDTRAAKPQAAAAAQPSAGRRYDALKREPKFAGAELSCLWEITSV